MWSTELGDLLITLPVSVMLYHSCPRACGGPYDTYCHIAILPYCHMAVGDVAISYCTAILYCADIFLADRTVLPYCLIAVGGLGVLVIHASFVSMYDMLMQICCALNSYLKC